MAGPSIQHLVAAGSGVFDEIDTHRYLSHRPVSTRLRIHELEKKSKRVINEHLLTRGHLNLIRNKALDQMPVKLGVAFEGRENRTAPVFIGVIITMRRTNSEGRHLVEKKLSP